MPVWHERTRELQETGKLQLLGIIQEQHPDRCRLFMQWHRMNWPILVDSLNRLEVEAVPITLLIDEHGVIRAVNPRPKDVETFLSSDFKKPEGSPPRTEEPNLIRLKASADAAQGPGPIRNYADALVQWGGSDGMRQAIGLYRKALERDGDDPVTHFRLGVAYRKRFDSVERAAGDFAGAIRHWSRALELDPNQYIWRRRIQQYGPRLDKPYSFYDWVHTARDAIRARGEEPLSLAVEPGGAEFAEPQRGFFAAETGQEPDVAGRIQRDTTPFIRLETTVVPSTTDNDGKVTARVHLDFRPNLAVKAHWNNEADGLKVWLNAPDDWSLDAQSIEVPNSDGPIGRGAKHVEFEVRGPAGGSAAVLEGYALYYVCEDVNGICLYRRHDFRVRVGGP